MNSIPGREPRADTLDINQPKETHKKGLLLGTDFRHAVEFSRSGRATTPASRPSSWAASLCGSARRAGPWGHPGGHTQAVSRGAEAKLRAPASGVKPHRR